MYCTACGKKIEENERFCGACGHQVQNSKPQNGTKRTYKKPKTLGMILAIIAGAVLTVFVCYYGFTLYILSTKESDIFDFVSYNYMTKYGVLAFPNISDRKIQIVGKKAIITGKYSPLSNEQKYTGDINPDHTHAGEFILVYDDMFEYSPDEVTLIDSDCD